MLINAQEGKTKALRQWRMTSVKDIKPAIVKRYLNEALEIANAQLYALGLMFAFRRNKLSGSYWFLTASRRSKLT